MSTGYTKARMRATNKYIRENYWRPSVTIPKGRRADVEAYCNQSAGSVNGMLNKLLREALGMTEEEWKAKV